MYGQTSGNQAPQTKNSSTIITNSRLRTIFMATPRVGAKARMPTWAPADRRRFLPVSGVVLDASIHGPWPRDTMRGGEVVTPCSGGCPGSCCSRC
jgi:hypothetical protein